MLWDGVGKLHVLVWFDHPGVLCQPSDVVGGEKRVQGMDGAVMNRLLNVGQVTAESKLLSGEEPHGNALSVSRSREGQTFSRIEHESTSRREQLHPGAESLEEKDSLDDRG